MQKLLGAHKLRFLRSEGKNASHRKRTFETLSDGKLHCFPKQYWNQNKYFILISIDFSTRVCSLVRCFDIFQNWRLSHYYDLEFAFKSFFLLASNLGKENFFVYRTREKKTLISKQKFGIKCQQSEKHIIWLIAQHLSIEADESLRYIEKISSGLRLGERASPLFGEK